MDLLHLPLISYFVNWRLVQGTYVMGFLGLLVCTVACVACWYQIVNDQDEQH